MAALDLGRVSRLTAAPSQDHNRLSVKTLSLTPQPQSPTFSGHLDSCLPHPCGWGGQQCDRLPTSHSSVALPNLWVMKLDWPGLNHRDTKSLQTQLGQKIPEGKSHHTRETASQRETGDWLLDLALGKLWPSLGLSGHISELPRKGD